MDSLSLLLLARLKKATKTPKVVIVDKPSWFLQFESEDINFSTPEDVTTYTEIDLYLDLPTEVGLFYSFKSAGSIDWGDGSESEVTSGTEITHTYTNAGVYTIKASDIKLQADSGYNCVWLTDSPSFKGQSYWKGRILGFRSNYVPTPGSLSLFEGKAVINAPTADIDSNNLQGKFNILYCNCASISHYQAINGSYIILGSDVASLTGSLYLIDTYILQLLSETPPSLGGRFYNENSTPSRIIVPYSEDHSVLEAYQTATNWSAYASIIEEAAPTGGINE